MRYVLALVALIASPVVAQTTANLPVTCNSAGTVCVQATAVTNPDGSLIGAGGGGGSTPTGAAGSPNAAVVTVQGITNGTPQRITGIGQTASATGQTVVPATDSAAFPNNLTSVGGGAVTLGQKTMAASLPVTLASDGTYATAANQRGGANLATGQISVTTASTLIAAARAGRQRITVSVGAANTCAFGNTGVTTTTGFPLQPVAGATITLDTATALYAACSATTTVSYVELF